VHVQSTRNVLVVDLNGVTDVNPLLPLLTGKGTLGFYETYDRTEILSALPAGDPLFSLMKIPEIHSSEMIARDVLGTCQADNMAAVEAQLKKHELLGNGIRVSYCWSLQGSPEGQFDLHLLKNRAGLDRSMVLNTSVSGEGSEAALLISFNTQGAQAWQSLSAANIGKSIALVIDGRVIMDPMVRDEIKNGQCMVTGNFETKELLVLKALVNNDELPAALKVIQ
jgi:preprotein translocase subunit SecD